MKGRTFDTIEVINDVTVKTGNVLFDEWFSRDSGIVPGTSVFVTGNSGAGKTTLMLNLMSWLKGHKCSFYSREMSLSSIKNQVMGLNFDNPDAHFADFEDCSHVNEYISYLDVLKPSFLIIDSLQSIAEQDYPEMGTDKASVIVRNMFEKWCKINNATLFLIGHNTKDNEFAGKNVNMQMMDAHMVLEYDQKTGIRKIYWGKKNRKGPLVELNYRIENGNIEFYKDTDEVNFSDDFQIFVETYLKKFDKNSSTFKAFKKEMNVMSHEVYNKHDGYEYLYMMEFLPRFYKLLNQYQMA